MKRWAWASGLQWYEGKMDYYAAGPIRERFRQFCELNGSRPSGIQIDEGGREWPDWLGSGGGLPKFYLSGRVISALEREGIRYRRITEMPIGSILEPVLQEIPPPKYYVLEATEALGVKIIENPGGNYVYTYSPNDIPETDLLAHLQPVAIGQSWLAVYGSERIVRLAQSEGWTNFEAEELVAA